MHSKLMQQAWHEFAAILSIAPIVLGFVGLVVMLVGIAFNWQ